MVFEKMKGKAAERRERREYEAAQAALVKWESEVSEVESLLATSRDFEGFDPAEAESPLQLKKGEVIFAIVENAALVEPRRLPGKWQGGSQAVSFRVAKGVYWRTGGTRGTYAQGEEAQQIIDDGGTAVITNQRIVFLGTKNTREWAFSKLLGVQHDQDLGVTYIQVSNRQKVSGFGYGGSAADTVRFRVDLALAVFNGKREEMVAELEEELGELKRERPALPPPPPPAE